MNQSEARKTLQEICELCDGAMVEVRASTLATALEGVDGRVAQDLHMGATRAMGSAEGSKVKVTCEKAHVLEALAARPKADAPPKPKEQPTK